jgi:hypothetical protein
MRLLHDEVIRRFPEIRPHLYGGDDEDSPYVLMHLVVSWLKELSPCDLTPELVQRVVDFGKWCKDQPRGENAANDVLTTWIVGFLEELFDSDATRPLIPHLVAKEDLIENAEYWKKWVTPENYQSSLGEY